METGITLAVGIICGAVLVGLMACVATMVGWMAATTRKINANRSHVVANLVAVAKDSVEINQRLTNSIEATLVAVESLSNRLKSVEDVTSQEKTMIGGKENTESCG